MALVYEAMILAALVFLATALVLIFAQDAILPTAHWFKAYLLAVLGAYFGYCWTRSGQTVGMYTWRLLLTDSAGKRVRWPHALLRFALATALGAGLIGLLWQLIDPEKLALQDRLSKTRVLRLAPRV
jgi:uncharacterized RDD family membrane protein YckC